MTRTDTRVVFVHASVDLYLKNEIEHFLTRQLKAMTPQFDNFTERLLEGTGRARLHGLVADATAVVLVVTPNLMTSPFLTVDAHREVLARRLKAGDLTVSVL